MIIVADNLQILNPEIQKALSDQNPTLIQSLVHRFRAAGADALDVNCGPLSRKTIPWIGFLMQTARTAGNCPLFIDTANPDAVKAGLETVSSDVTINGFSLEPRKLSRILPLAKTYQTDIIGYLLRPDGHVPTSASERLSLAVDLYAAFMETGLPPDRLIIDPVLVPLTWQDGHIQAREILSVIRTLPDLLGFPVRTIVGLSNLTAGSPKTGERLRIESTYVPMLAASGLSMLLMNVTHTKSMETIQICRSLLGNQVFSWRD